VKIEPDAVLTCTACGVEGPHELLYLSDRVRASRCASCGKTRTYSGHIYSEYARDLVERTTHLPARLASEALHRPLAVFWWPTKALLKPLGLLREVSRLNTFEKASHPPPPRAEESAEAQTTEV
jgi:hypothetical protein